MPEIFRHYAKCLITQIACNIYTVTEVAKDLFLQTSALTTTVCKYVHVYIHAQ